MKSSWISGIVTLYLIILGCAFMAEGGTTGDAFSSIATDNASVFIRPSYSSFDELVSFKEAGEFLKNWGQMLMLYSPTVFDGQMIWFYWFFCFPVACAMIFTIFAIVFGRL